MKRRRPSGWTRGVSRTGECDGRREVGKIIRLTHPRSINYSANGADVDDPAVTRDEETRKCLDHPNGALEVGIK